MAIYVRTCRNRLGRDYAPLAVYLRRPEPEDRINGTKCSARRCRRRPLEFAPDFDSHLDDANPELAEHNETVLKRTLAQLNR
jgi:hypothetical protein